MVKVFLINQDSKLGILIWTPHIKMGLGGRDVRVDECVPDLLNSEKQLWQFLSVDI